MVNMNNQRDIPMQAIKEEFFGYFLSTGPYALHEFEDAWEAAEIKFEEGLLAKGQVIYFAFQCLPRKSS